jgi:hypothetical protein
MATPRPQLRPASHRYTVVNGPRYAICPLASSTSPVSCVYCSASEAAAAVHRVCGAAGQQERQAGGQTGASAHGTGVAQDAGSTRPTGAAALCREVRLVSSCLPTFSPPSPEMSFSARSSLTVHMCTSCSSLSLRRFLSCARQQRQGSQAAAGQPHPHARVQAAPTPHCSCTLLPFVPTSNSPSSCVPAVQQLVSFHLYQSQSNQH